jgi:hypothetical protein
MISLPGAIDGPPPPAGPALFRERRFGPDVEFLQAFFGILPDGEFENVTMPKK